MSVAHGWMQGGTGGGGTNRRDFLRRVAAGGAGLLLPSLVSGCSGAPFDPAAEAVLDTRSEAGVMNVLYALNQLNGDFFTRVARFRYVGMTSAELSFANAVLFGEWERANWFAAEVRTGRIYDYLEVDFSEVDFKSRANVLEVAHRLKEASAAAYPGAQPLIRTPAWAEGVAQAAEREAEQLATIQEMAAAEDDVAKGAGHEVSPLPPAEAIRAVESFFRTRLVIRS